MNVELMIDAMNGVSNRYKNEVLCEDRYSPDTSSELKPASGRKPVSKVGRTLLIAAVIASLFAITAYAAGWFGLRALRIENENMKPFKYEKQSDGTLASVENPDGAFVSIAQPQNVPEEMSPEIRNKIDNSKVAWEEWSKWKSERYPVNPYEDIEPDAALSCDAEDNGDGTYTLIYYLGDNKVEKHVVSPESWFSFIDFVHLMGQGGIDGYDHKYGVYTQDMADKIE